MLRAPRARQVLRGQQERTALMERTVRQDPQDPQEPQEPLVLTEQMAPMVLRDPQDPRDPRDPQGQMALTVLMERKVQSVR